MSKLTRSISFEFFPPKNLEATQKLYECAGLLSKLDPDFFSVTFGAGGSTREGTLQAVKLLQQKTRIEIAPHLACVAQTRQELIDILVEYQQLGVKRIVALRGDLPSGAGQSGGDFNYASQLIELIREITDDYFHLEVAAYPEMHPQANSFREDVLNLKRKYLAGADSAITQYFFNSDAYFYFLDACEKEGVNLPIVPGIMPIMQFSKLMRFSELCGAEIPRWLCKKLEAYGDDIESIQQFGLDFVYELCDRLLTGGAPGLHLYTLNQAEISLRLVEALRRNNKLLRQYHTGTA